MNCCRLLSFIGNHVNAALCKQCSGFMDDARRILIYEKIRINGDGLFHIFAFIRKRSDRTSVDCIYNGRLRPSALAQQYRLKVR